MLHKRQTIHGESVVILITFMNRHNFNLSCDIYCLAKANSINAVLIINIIIWRNVYHKEYQTVMKTKAV